MRTSVFLAALSQAFYASTLASSTWCLSVWSGLFLYLGSFFAEYGCQFQILPRLQTKLLRRQTNNDPWSCGLSPQPLSHQDARAKGGGIQEDYLKDGRPASSFQAGFLLNCRISKSCPLLLRVKCGQRFIAETTMIRTMYIERLRTRPWMYTNLWPT